MAFTGTAAVTKISDSCYRITGLSLAFGASGTIALAAGTGDVELPEPDWRAEGDIGLDEAVEVSCHPVADVEAFAVPIRVVKTGATPALFVATLTNDSAATNSAALEIYVKRH